MTSQEVANERTRLLASALNTAAASSLTLGVVAPLLTVLSCDASRTASLPKVAAAACLGLTMASLLHSCARAVLARPGRAGHAPHPGR